MERNVIIIENPSEIGAGVRGAGLGPVAVRMEEHRLGNHIYSRFPFKNIDSYNHELVRESPYKHAKYIDFIQKQNERLVEEVQDELKLGRFPLIISGDHSNAMGSIAAMRDFYPDKRLGVIWIDAHADLHTPYTTPSGNVHGMPLGASLGEGYASDATNTPHANTLAAWEQLTHLGPKHIHPKVEPQDLVMIAIRDLEDEEWQDIDDNEIMNYVPARMLNKTMTEVAEESLEYLSACDHIYISFDVDSMDPSVSKGTGTSVENGLTLDQAVELLSVLYQSEKVSCLEITEINPLIDVENKMAKAVIHILRKLLL
ncbi:MAG: arginase [Flavobacteriales bacterium]|nr:arginase [Bacteroidota bacterium]MCB9241419.1 arginase [Flavobacteriales bacterium]